WASEDGDLFARRIVRLRWVHGDGRVRGVDGQHVAIYHLHIVDGAFQPIVDGRIHEIDGIHASWDREVGLGLVVVLWLRHYIGLVANSRLDGRFVLQISIDHQHGWTDNGSSEGDRAFLQQNYPGDYGFCL